MWQGFVSSILGALIVLAFRVVVVLVISALVFIGGAVVFYALNPHGFAFMAP